MNTETFQIFTTKEHKELKEKFFVFALFCGLCVLVVKNLFQ
jgi:hypothetical protein